MVMISLGSPLLYVMPWVDASQTGSEGSSPLRKQNSQLSYLARGLGVGDGVFVGFGVEDGLRVSGGRITVGCTVGNVWHDASDIIRKMSITNFLMDFIPVLG